MPTTWRARDRSSSTKPAAGLEGIVSKRADRPYISGRGKDWLKIKCQRGEEFVIGGYSRSEVRGKPFSSLLLGTFEDGKLIYRRQGRHRLRRRGFRCARAQVQAAGTRQLALRRGAPRGAQRCGLARAKTRGAGRFTERTRDGRLRHPSFKGLREDKPAREVHREAEGRGGRHGHAKSASAKRSGRSHLRRHHAHQSRQGLSRHRPDQARHRPILRDVAPFILPYVANRPISLVRCPEGIDGERFFQRHAMKGMSKAIKQMPIPAARARSPISISMTRRGCSGWCRSALLEIHDWGVSLDHIGEPDRLVFDLDPDEGLRSPC